MGIVFDQPLNTTDTPRLDGLAISDDAITVPADSLSIFNQGITNSDINYERMRLYHDGTEFVFTSEIGGTGTQQNVLFNMPFRWETPSGSGSDFRMEVTDGSSILDIFSYASNTSPRIRLGGTTPGTSEATTLWHSEGSGVHRLNIGDRNGVIEVAIRKGASGYVSLSNTNFFGISSTQSAVSPDVKLYRDDVGVWAVRNGTNAMAMRFYNTWTDASNNEYLEAGFDTDIAYLRTVANGTGTQRNLVIDAAETINLVTHVGGANANKLFVTNLGTNSVFNTTGTLLFRRDGITKATLDSNGFTVNDRLYVAGTSSYIDRGGSSLYIRDSTRIDYNINGTNKVLIDVNGVDLTDQLDMNSNDILGLDRIQATSHIISQYDTTNEQRYRLFNTRTDASNNEYLEAGFDTNDAYLRVVNNGTGTARDLRIYAGTSKTIFFGNGTTPLMQLTTSSLSPDTDGLIQCGTNTKRFSWGYFDDVAITNDLTLGAGGTQSFDLTTSDDGFINFQATADGDTTSAISTLTTSGSTTHHIQVEINGTKAWIAASTNAPS